MSTDNHVHRIWSVSVGVCCISCCRCITVAAVSTILHLFWLTDFCRRCSNILRGASFLSRSPYHRALALAAQEMRLGECAHSSSFDPAEFGGVVGMAEDRPDFGGLVVGCVKPEFCNYSIVLKRLSSSAIRSLVFPDRCHFVRSF